MSRTFLRAAGLGALLLIGVVGTAFPSSAAMDIFLKIKEIPGSSADAKHKDEIQLESIQYGMNNAGTASFGGGGGAGKVQFQDIQFTKKLDKSSPSLMSHCLTGRHLPKAEITTRKAGNNPVDFYKVTLSDVAVTGYAMSVGGDIPMESISLNFARVEWEYSIQAADGSVRPAAKGSFDVKAGKGSTVGSSPPPPAGPGGALDPNRVKMSILSAPGTGAFSSLIRRRSLGGGGIFAKITGIDGESRAAKHENEIEINSFSWGMLNPGGFAAGGGGGGKVNLGDWTASKELDKSAVPLMVHCATGNKIPQVVIALTKGQNQQEFLKITFKDVLVTSYSQATTAGAERPMESLSLNFSQMEWEFKEQNAQGQLVPTGKVTFDQKLGK